VRPGQAAPIDVERPIGARDSPFDRSTEGAAERRLGCRLMRRWQLCRTPVRRTHDWLSGSFIEGWMAGMGTKLPKKRNSRSMWQQPADAVEKLAFWRKGRLGQKDRRSQSLCIRRSRLRAGFDIPLKNTVLSFSTESANCGYSSAPVSAYFSSQLALKFDGMASAFAVVRPRQETHWLRPHKKTRLTGGVTKSNGKRTATTICCT